MISCRDHHCFSNTVIGWSFRVCLGAEELEQWYADRRDSISSSAIGRYGAFSSSEAALLLVSTKNRDLNLNLWLEPLAWSFTGSPRFTDFPSLCACSESSLTNLIGSGLNLLCFQSHSKTECRWTGPEVAILGADQKEHGLWGREWLRSRYGVVRERECSACV